MAKHSVIDATRIKGTGPEGRVVEKDVRNYLQQHGYDKLRISPAAKELAAKEKLDVLAIQGTDDSGRITVADVQRALAEKPKPMSKMRQVIAQRLTQSFRDTPHFYLTISVDMTELIAYRNQLKAAGAPYTVTDFIAEAVVLTLQEFPAVNSATDGKTTRWNSHVNLGIAVSLEQGLVVPVIRAAEHLPLIELCQQSKALVEKARAGKATPDELSGGTFTISNMGMMDVESFGAHHQSRRKRHPRRGQHQAAAGRARRQNCRAPDDEAHALVRPSHRGRRARRKIHQRHQTNLKTWNLETPGTLEHVEARDNALIVETLN